MDRDVVSKGLDESKDQSYVLMGRYSGMFEKNYFSNGKYHKKDIKQMAIDRGYHQLAEKMKVMRSVLFQIMITEDF